MKNEMETEITIKLMFESLLFVSKFMKQDVHTTYYNVFSKSDRELYSLKELYDYIDVFVEDRCGKLKCPDEYGLYCLGYCDDISTADREICLTCWQEAFKHRGSVED